MKVMQNGELLGTITTNHRLTTDEALKLIGATPYPFDPDVDNADAPTHIMSDGTEVWFDNVTIVD